MIVLTGLLKAFRAAQRGIEDRPGVADANNVFLFPLEMNAQARAKFAQSGQKGEHKCHRSNLFSQRALSRFSQDASHQMVNVLRLVQGSVPWALRLWTAILSPAQQSARPQARYATTRASADHNTGIIQSNIQSPRGLRLRGNITFLPASTPRCAGIFC
jgi:hypothetical protein